MAGRPLVSTPVQVVLDRRPGRTSAEAERLILPGRTDSTGHFALGYPTSQISAASLWVDVGDGWQLVDLLHGFDDEPGDRSLSLKLRPRDREFRIDVRDQTNRPVSGATVQLIAGEGAAPAEHLQARITDQRGALVWPGVSWGGWWAEISSPGYAAVRTCPYQFLATDGASRRYEVRLLTGRDLAVEVLDEDGRPAAGAELEFAYANHDLPTYSRWIVKADARGMASFTIPRDVETVITATSPGHEAAATTAGDADRLTLQLRATPRDER